MKFKRFLLVLAFFGLPTFAAYQQQGFDQFQEFDGNMTFSCTGQCIALIGSIAGSDYASIKGSLQGSGIVGYGFLVGQQIAPGQTLQLNGPAMLDQQFSFSALPYFSQIPSDAQLVLVVQGNISGAQVSLQPGFMNFYQKIGKGWKDFWTFDTFKPYTINLLYGPRIAGKSANGIFYRIFFIGVAVLLLKFGWKNKKIVQFILILGLILWGLFDLRMFSEFTKYTTDNYHKWIQTPIAQKNYKDIYGNFPLFADRVKEQLQILHIDIAMQHSDQNRPFEIFLKYQVYPIKISSCSPGALFSGQSCDLSKIETGNALIVWNSNVTVSGTVVHYKNNEKSFPFTGVLTNPLFPNSFIFYK